MHSSTEAALEAHSRGYTPVPIRDGDKRPYGARWTRLAFDTPQAVETSFEQWAEQGATNIGLLLGESSDGLVDVDLDHPAAVALRDHFLPRTGMESGRTSRPGTHRWYRVTDNLPSSRPYKMPGGGVSVEIRSTGAQTLIAPSTHPSGDQYEWSGGVWGEPAEVDGRVLAVQVALLGLGAILVDAWPDQGGRHDTYLALAGGLLRFGDDVHPFWDRNLPTLISALADATHDEDGGDTRVAEVMETTRRRIADGTHAVGFPKLGELIGVDAAEAARRQAKTLESLAGFTGTPITRETATGMPEQRQADADPDELPSTLEVDDAHRDPMSERLSTWASVDLGPYLTGEIQIPAPSVLDREDGQSLFYPGRVNSLFGKSEAAKTWIMLHSCVQEMGKGERVLFIDLEDEPTNALGRLFLLGAGADDLRHQFKYVHPEGPIAPMQRSRFGSTASDAGVAAQQVFLALLDEFDPTLVVVDGMTSLFGLHGHDTNDAGGTDVVTTWLKSLTRYGRSTVVVIDHTTKSGGPHSSPIGAHHKIAMVQGTALRADAIDRPMPGEKGHVQLVTYKDRIGKVRAASTKPDGDREQVAADVRFDSTDPSKVVVTVEAPDPNVVVLGSTPAEENALARLADLDDNKALVVALFDGDADKQVKTADAVTLTGLSRDQVLDAIRALKADGVVEQLGEKRGTRYRLRSTDDGDHTDY